MLTYTPAFLLWHCRDIFPCQLWNALYIFCFRKGRSHILWYWVILWREWYTTVSTSEIYHNKRILRHTSLDFVWECRGSAQCTYSWVENLHSFYVVFPLYFSKHNLRMYDCVEQINNAIPCSVSCLLLDFLIILKLATSVRLVGTKLARILHCTIVEQDRNLAWSWLFSALWLLRYLPCTILSND